jgi:hydrogenase expression/formation protein HypE
MNFASHAPRLATRRLDIAGGRVDLTHGAGGRAMQQLIAEIFRPAFDNPMLARGDDQAAFEVSAGRIFRSTRPPTAR